MWYIKGKLAGVAFIISAIAFSGEAYVVGVLAAIACLWLLFK